MTTALPDDLLRFLEETDSVADIPRQLKKVFAADECVIWKPSKRLVFGEPLKPPYSQCRLYPLTSTFIFDQGALHSGLPLDFENDSTGRIYKEHWEADWKPLPLTARINNNFPATDSNALSVGFMQRLRLLRMCTSVFFFDKQSAPYAVSLYRRNLSTDNMPSDEFTPEQLDRLDYYTRLIPFLMRRHLDGHFRDLTREVHQALSPSSTWEDNTIDGTLERLCKKLAVAFHCTEVSLILQDANTSPPFYTLRASTLGLKNIGRVSFRASKCDGLTGYSLATGKILEFHDLSNFKDEAMREVIRKNWGNEIDWKDSADIVKFYRKQNPSMPEAILPPVAFLAVPIPRSAGDPSVTGMPIGIIRCSLGTNPYYFTPGEKDMLSLVATTIGHWWSDVLEVTEQKNRANLFRCSLEIHEELQVSIWKSIQSGHTTKDGVIGGVIKALFDKFDGVKLACYRRERKHTRGNTMTVAEIAHAENREVKLLLRTVFDDGEFPLAAPLLAEGPDLQWYQESDIETSQSQKERRLFSGMKEVLSVRVGLLNYTVGVLDFGFTDIDLDPQYKGHFQRVALDIAQLLALYELVRKNQKQLQRSLADQILMTQSVGHQIKSPLANALDVLRQIYRPLQAAQRNSSAYLHLGQKLTTIVPQRIPKLLGMVGKAQAVGRFMESFGKLSKGEKVVWDVESWPVSSLLRLVHEIARNNLVSQESLENRDYDGHDYFDRDFAFNEDLINLDDDTFKLCYSRIATEQVIDAVIGNALKYRRLNTAIEVNLTKTTRQLQVAITNIADDEVFLSLDDAQRCFEKGWRAPSTGGRIGSGLGLWIAQQLMRQQKGDLEALATYDGKTTFHLLFEIEQ